MAVPLGFFWHTDQWRIYAGNFHNLTRGRKTYLIIGLCGAEGVGEVCGDAFVLGGASSLVGVRPGLAGGFCGLAGLVGGRSGVGLLGLGLGVGRRLLGSQESLPVHLCRRIQMLVLLGKDLRDDLRCKLEAYGIQNGFLDRRCYYCHVPKPKTNFKLWQEIGQASVQLD